MWEQHLNTYSIAMTDVERQPAAALSGSGAVSDQATSTHAVATQQPGQINQPRQFDLMAAPISGCLSSLASSSFSSLAPSGSLHPSAATAHHATLSAGGSPVVDTSSAVLPPPPSQPHLIIDTISSMHTAEAAACTLRQVLDHPHVPARFRVVVRIRDLLPRDPGNPFALIEPFCTFCAKATCDEQCVVPHPPAVESELPAARAKSAAPSNFEALLCSVCHGGLDPSDPTAWVYKAVFR